jgi:DivIVA domain-containing protein
MEFDLALRGYDRLQVDVMVQRAEVASASTDPALRARTCQELRSVQFAVVLRGYQRAQVDSFLKAVSAELEAGG